MFGWSLQPIDGPTGLRYSVHRSGDEMFAGIWDGEHDLPSHVPSTWLVSFGVEGTDAALERAVRLGGAANGPAHDSPYGRSADVSDPTGARFAIIDPNQSGASSGGR